MKKIEQLHLEAIESCEYEEIKNSAIYKMNFKLAASKSAEITEGIAIEFAIWLNKTDEIIENTKHIDFSKSDEDVAKELYQEFLKTKQ